MRKQDRIAQTLNLIGTVVLGHDDGEITTPRARTLATRLLALVRSDDPRFNGHVYGLTDRERERLTQWNLLQER